MSISNYKAAGLFILALLLAGCEWALGSLPARTNPVDLGAPVAYFRATPQDNGGNMDEVRLTWKWGGEGNPGEVRILRREYEAPAGSDDPSATLVYRSDGDATFFVDDFGDPTAGPDQTGRIFYYTLFYSDDSGEVATEPSPAVFTSNSVTLTQVQGFTFLYTGTIYSTDTVCAVELNLSPPPERYGLIYIGFAGLPGLNIDVTSATLTIPNSPTGASIRFNRMISPLTDGLSNEEYFSRVKLDYTNTDQVILGSVAVPQDIDITGIFRTWLDTLQPYGLRVETLSVTGYTEFLNPTVTVDYIGP